MPFFIGLMSGTSLDGVDAALVDFSGKKPRVIATDFAPFDAALRACLLALQSPGENELERAALAAGQLAHAYARGVQAVLVAAGVPADQVRAIGAHGQTVRHRPEAGFTVQLNNPALLAELTGIAVAADFRSRDIAAGGQGAPLAPAFHHAFFAEPGQTRVVLNIGGIANATLLAADGSVKGFDSGPGNVLMDSWCALHRGAPFDASGAWASGGHVVPELLKRMLREPYFALPAPKSTGRDLFNQGWLDRHLAQLPQAATMPAQDVQATLLELTARTICDALAGVDSSAVYVCGGGASNTRLLERIAELCAPAQVSETSPLGIPPDWVEAVAFGWLAKCLVEETPANLPAVTGARGLRLLGAYYPG